MPSTLIEAAMAKLAMVNVFQALEFLGAWLLVIIRYDLFVSGLSRVGVGLFQAGYNQAGLPIVFISGSSTAAARSAAARCSRRSPASLWRKAAVEN
ncbi:hypothetical protein [Mesorhizobium kowhaii]|uniref:hypothetical protein n=1 Tax=Mesorhizobium kowhaii TaxID=1300272 RepID=UPI001ABF64FA|nr:hypothetical protein [Mesorhizobium kowhaii]